MEASVEQARAFVLSRRGKITKHVKDTLSLLTARHPEIRKVVLVGSYANGDWIDSDTPQWFIDYRKSTGKKISVSDVDFYTEPLVQSTSEYDIQQTPRGNKILIYDNGNSII